MTQRDQSTLRICECCETERAADAPGWIVSRDGEDFCPECAESLVAELRRMVDALPKRIGLCPQCAPEFYYPLADGEGVGCPSAHCSLDMIVYVREEVGR